MKLVYDVTSTPKGLDFANMVKMYENHNVVFWDSATGGVKPKLYAKDDVPAALCIVDLAGQELDIEMYSKMFKDQEFWERELHYCKNSPIYHFSNYLTKEFPATNDGIKEYLHSLGMENIISADGDSATALWEAQKIKLAKISEGLTIESLQQNKALIEVLKGSYEKSIDNMVKALQGKVVVTVNGEALPEKVRTTNLVEAIRKVKKVPETYSDYATISGKWNSPMLYSTPYGALLKIAYTVL